MIEPTCFRLFKGEVPVGAPSSSLGTKAVSNSSLPKASKAAVAQLSMSGLAEAAVAVHGEMAAAHVAVSAHACSVIVHLCT